MRLVEILTEGRDDADGRIQEAVDLLQSYHDIDGDHHQKWLGDQILRALLRDQYEAFIAEYEAGDYGPETYQWEKGVAP